MSLWLIYAIGVLVGIAISLLMFELDRQKGIYSTNTEKFTVTTIFALWWFVSIPLLIVVRGIELLVDVFLGGKDE